MASWRRMRPGSSRGRNRASTAAASGALEFAAHTTRRQFGEEAMQPTDRLGAQRDELLAPVGQQPQRHRGVVEGHGLEPAGVEADRHGVVAVGLSAVALGEDPHSSSELGGHVDHTLAVGHEALRQRPAGAVATLDRPAAVRPSTARIAPARGSPLWCSRTALHRLAFASPDRTPLTCCSPCADRR